MKQIAVSLYDKTGNMLRPWADAGWECWAVDIQHGIREDYAAPDIPPYQPKEPSDE